MSLERHNAELTGFDMKTDPSSVSHAVLIACDLVKLPGTPSYFFVE